MQQAKPASALPFLGWKWGGLACCVVGGLWLLGSQTAWGEPAPVHLFWAAIDNAQARSPILQRQSAALRAAREVEPQSRSKLLPTVSASASSVVEQSTYYHRSDTSSSNAPTQVGITVVQPIFNYTDIVGREQSSPHIEAAVADLDYARQSLVVSTATLISNWLEAREVYELSDQYTQVTARHAHVVGLRFKAGESTETEVHEAESRSAQAEASKTNARNVMDKAAASFAEVVGELPSARLVLPEFNWQEPAHFEEQLAKLIEGRADVRGARARMQESSIAVRMRRAEHAPSLRFTYNASRTWNEEMGTGPGVNAVNQPSTKEEIDNQTAMLLLDIPIFNGGMVTSRTRQAQAEWESQVADLDRLRQLALREAQEARMDVANLQLSIIYQERALRSNQKALAGLQEAFLAGTRTILELLDTQFETLTIQTNLVRSRYQHRLARIRLWAAMGWPLVPEHALTIVAENGIAVTPDTVGQSVATVHPSTPPAAVDNAATSVWTVTVQETDLADPHTGSPVSVQTPAPGPSSEADTVRLPRGKEPATIPATPPAPLPSVSAKTHPLLPESGTGRESVLRATPNPDDKRATRTNHTTLLTPPEERMPKMGWGPYYACIGIYLDTETTRPIEQTLAKQGVYTLRETARTWDNRTVLRLLVGPFADFTDLTQARKQLEDWTQTTPGWVRNRRWPPVLQESANQATGVQPDPVEKIPEFSKEMDQKAAAGTTATEAGPPLFQASGPFFADIPRQSETTARGPLYPHLSEGPFYVHLGAYLTEEEREKVKRTLTDRPESDRGPTDETDEEWRAQRVHNQRDSLQSPEGKPVHRLLAGPFDSYEESLQAKRAIQRETGVLTGTVDNPQWEDHQNCPNEALLRAAAPDTTTLRHDERVDNHIDFNDIAWQTTGEPSVQ